MLHALGVPFLRLGRRARVGGGRFCRREAGDRGGAAVITSGVGSVGDGWAAVPGSGYGRTRNRRAARRGKALFGDRRARGCPLRNRARRPTQQRTETGLSASARSSRTAPERTQPRPAAAARPPFYSAPFFCPPFKITVDIRAYSIPFNKKCNILLFRARQALYAMRRPKKGHIARALNPRYNRSY